jgi:hypothetical protein
MSGQIAVREPEKMRGSFGDGYNENQVVRWLDKEQP